MVRFENVGLRYGLGPEVLKDVNFELQKGSFHFLIGESGAGKSSLLKLIYLALKPSRGLISLFDHDIAITPRPDLPALRRRVGVVFQEFKLLNHLSAYDNVALPLRVAGVRESVVKKHVSELLAWVGLEQHMQARPPTLSGGQQQRVSIARAIIARPRLLLADEPTGNVDDVMGFRLMHLFEELNRLGTTVVIATHNMQVVERLGHGRLLLDDGRLIMESARAKIAPKVENLVPGSRQKALAAAEASAAADSFGKYPGDSEIFDDPSSLKDYL
ncbi:MAG: cell division ATP-binding protein FtsE [Rhodospirillales bacterium]